MQFREPFVAVATLGEGQSRGTNQWDCLALVAPVDSKIGLVRRDHAVPGMQLTHADETEIGQIGLPVGVPRGQSRQLTTVLLEVEIQSDESLGHHRQRQGDVPKMKCRLGENRLARQERLGDPFGQPHGPRVVHVRAVGKCDEEPRVGDALHDLENPFLVERFFGAFIDPARRMKDCVLAPALAFSSWSRTIFPWATPVFAAVSSSHRASSGSRRTVIV